jgi:hypothetical protein
MTKTQQTKCAEMVEQIRRAARAKPYTPEEAEYIGERCDQLIMMLQPIRITRPKGPQ